MMDTKDSQGVLLTASYRLTCLIFVPQFMS